MCTSRLNELDLDICQRTPAEAPVIRGGRFGFSRNLRKKRVSCSLAKPFLKVVFWGRNYARTRRNLNLIPDCQSEYLTPELTASQILCVLRDD